MKCGSCGYLSLEERERCPRCGEALGEGLGNLRLDPAAGGARRPRDEAPGRIVLPPPGERAGEIGMAAFADDENLPDVDADAPLPRGEEGPEAVFSLEDDLIPPVLPWGAAGEDGWEEASAPASGGPGALPEAPPGAGPVIDSEEEVSELFWAPEGAGLARRAVAAVLDGFLLAAALGLFAAGAWGALRLGGLSPAALLDGEVLHAVLLPFGLLGLLLSFGYSVFFHGVSGATPGKRVAGLEVRSVDGEGLSGARLGLRWAGAVLAVCAAGAGVLWALFEPRRRGWADLLSGTVVAGRRRRDRR